MSHLADKDCALCGLTVHGEWIARENCCWFPVRKNIEGGPMTVHKNCLLNLRVDTVGFNLHDTLGRWSEKEKDKFIPFTHDWYVFIQDTEDYMPMERIKEFARKADWPEHLTEIRFVRGAWVQFIWNVKTKEMKEYEYSSGA